MPNLPYCGAPLAPGEFWARFNIDPVLITVLALLALANAAVAVRDRRSTAIAGWSIAAFALVSPLCALSVSLFAARVGQHMILALIAAPLIALTLPLRSRTPGWHAVAAAGVFAIALWAWHLPGPYDATFRSDGLYWAMHVTLFGSAVMLWRHLLHHPADDALTMLALGGFTTVQMGLIGAILTFVPRPLFSVHYTTTADWGLSPLADQALGGLLMWVPGTLFLLIAAKRTLDRLLPESRAGHA